MPSIARTCTGRAKRCPAVPRRWDLTLRLVEARLSPDWHDLHTLVLIVDAFHQGPFEDREVPIGGVPFYVVHPGIPGGQTSQALTAHIDVAPTLLGMAGVRSGQAGDLAGRELPGKDISQILSRSDSADVHALRSSILFTYSGLLLNDASTLEGIAKVVAAGENAKDPAVLAKHGIKPDLMKRGTIRTVYDGRYKFSRYFAPIERNSPATLGELYANNDVELFDLDTDPKEMTNLAADKRTHGELVLAMSAKLEAAIKAEFGADNGREMPDFEDITWAIHTVD